MLTVEILNDRLKYICNKEGVKTSSIALSALAECTGKSDVLLNASLAGPALCISMCQVKYR